MSARAPRLSIVVPCYNEERNIPALVTGSLQAIEGHDVELLIVDNGSSDESASLLRDFADKVPQLRVLSIPINQGYGHGVMAGLRAARGQFLGWMHGDLQSDARDLINWLEEAEASKAPRRVFYKAKRTGRPLIDRLFTLGMSITATLVTRRLLTDINAVPKLCHRSFIEGLEDDPSGDYMFELELLFLARKQGLEVIRKSVAFPERKHGLSSWNRGFFSRLTLSSKTLWAILKLGLGPFARRKKV